MYNFGSLIVMLFFCKIVEFKETQDDKSNKESLFEVRAVFINCLPYEIQDNPDSDVVRFERQEMFKYNSLQNCEKKLALTVKLTSNPDALFADNAKEHSSTGEEYIPIDHVFEGSERKRVRLLNPYVLRLQRDVPRQAYKLRRTDTVSGVFTRSNTASNLTNKNYQSNTPEENQNRMRRETNDQEMEDEELMLGSPDIVLDHSNPHKQSFSLRIGSLQELFKDHNLRINSDCGKQILPLANISYILKRIKRDSYDHLTKTTPVNIYTKKSFIYKDADKTKSINVEDFDQDTYDIKNTETEYRSNPKINRQLPPSETLFEETFGVVNSTAWNTETTPNLFTDKHKWNTDLNDHSSTTNLESAGRQRSEDGSNMEKDNFKPSRNFAVYEIGAPELWYFVKVQLFEKLSTPEGKTVWNDLTRGERACVSSIHPEWDGKDVHVRYRPSKWVSRDDFTLPVFKRLCLLEPLLDANYSSFDDDLVPKESANSEYIVVPIEDVVYVNDKKNLKKRLQNGSDGLILNENGEFLGYKDSIIDDEIIRNVEVRASRAIIGSSDEMFSIASMDDGQYLTMPHRQTHYAEIDVEVNADNNQLVRVGSSGRLATIVTDGLRKGRSVIYAQATNTGLTSARFKVLAKDWGPEISTLLNEKNSLEIMAGPVILPPQRTQRLRLDIPVDVPEGHCNVALVNDDDEPVAVREVTIKNGDRCFCVWHCECVCLNDDPKLLCRDMSESQQAAAGLPILQRPRYARSVCYHNFVYLNIFGYIIGTILFLLLLGFTKGIIGMMYPRVGQLGFEFVLSFPRKLNHYFEPHLQKRRVIYDKNGWPIHPDTHERTVRIIDCKDQLKLNITLFLVIPSMLLKQLFMSAIALIKPNMDRNQKKNEINRALERDIQRRRARVLRSHRKLPRQWMTPSAEELISDVMRDEVQAHVRLSQSCPCGSKACKSGTVTTDSRGFYSSSEMRPLLPEYKSECSLADSEEDTHYVLTQMQKSKESLARSHRKNSANSADKLKTPK